MASKTLVIVQSPSKAKTINKCLGSEYVVKSSVGHVRRLPKGCLLYTSPSPRDLSTSRMPSSA